MHRNGLGPSVEWAHASIAFQTVPGLGWRRHMSQIAAEIGTVLAGSRTAKNRQPFADWTDELVWTRRKHRIAREREVTGVEVNA
jgi:hypothetical protein